jgi:hypothetical protein
MLSLWTVVTIIRRNPFESLCPMITHSLSSLCPHGADYLMICCMQFMCVGNTISGRQYLTFPKRKKSDGARWSKYGEYAANCSLFSIRKTRHCWTVWGIALPVWLTGFLPSTCRPSESSARGIWSGSDSAWKVLLFWSASKKVESQWIPCNR